MGQEIPKSRMRKLRHKERAPRCPGIPSCSYRPVFFLHACPPSFLVCSLGLGLAAPPPPPPSLHLAWPSDPDVANQSHCDWFMQLVLVAQERHPRDSRACRWYRWLPVPQFPSQQSLLSGQVSAPALQHLDHEGKLHGQVGAGIPGPPLTATDKLRELSGPQSPHL